MPAKLPQDLLVNCQPFKLEWYTRQLTEHVEGYLAVALMTGLSMSSLRTMLSLEGGTIKRNVKRSDGLIELVTITKLSIPKPVRHKKAVGRPTKASIEQRMLEESGVPPDTPYDWAAAVKRNKQKM